VHEVLRVDGSIVEPTPTLTCGVDTDYVRGVGKLNDRLLILLDLDRLFGAADLATGDQPPKKKTAA
jgi:purine-binding chemotaxis protein CheW